MAMSIGTEFRRQNGLSGRATRVHASPVLADRLIEDIERSGAGACGSGKPCPGNSSSSTSSRSAAIRCGRRCELGELGLIERHQGIGTVVAARESSQTYVQTVTSPAELRNTADAPTSVIESQEYKANRKLAHVLGCRAAPAGCA